MSAVAHLEIRPAQRKSEESSAFRGRMLFDCTDILGALSRHSTVTGIDRVQLRLFSYVLTFQDDWEKNDFFLVYRDERGDLFEIEGLQARRFVKLAIKPKLNKDTMAAAATECLRGASRVVASAGDLYFIPGPFWTISTHEGLIPRLRAKGVVVGAYIYDLIPLTHPQFCMAAHCSMFATAFAEIAPQLDFALTISEFVANELRDMMASSGMPIPPILAAPLAHELESLADGDVKDPTTLNRLGGRPFVLCVGTIEARKNHIYLLNLWNMLARENVKPPLLVLVGRQGWRVADLTEQLQSLRFVNDTIRIVNDVSDAELASLYDPVPLHHLPELRRGLGSAGRRKPRARKSRRRLLRGLHPGGRRSARPSTSIPTTCTRDWRPSASC